MGYSYAEADAPFYRIRPTLRPPGQNVNMTKNSGKRTTTSTAGAPLTGGHARFDATAEEKLSASNSALIASLELGRKRIPSEWKDRLSARTVEEFQVAMNMLEENPNEEPGEELASLACATTCAAVIACAKFAYATAVCAPAVAPAAMARAAPLASAVSSDGSIATAAGYCYKSGCCCPDLSCV